MTAGRGAPRACLPPDPDASHACHWLAGTCVIRSPACTGRRPATCVRCLLTHRERKKARTKKMAARQLRPRHGLDACGRPLAPRPIGQPLRVPRQTWGRVSTFLPRHVSSLRGSVRARSDSPSTQWFRLNFFFIREILRKHQNGLHFGAEGILSSSEMSPISRSFMAMECYAPTLFPYVH